METFRGSVFKIEATTEGRVRILVITGELDLSNCSLFQQELAKQLIANGNLLLHFETQAFDTESLKAVIAVNHLAKRQHCRLVAVASRTEQMVFDILKNTQHEIPTFRTREEALESLY